MSAGPDGSDDAPETDGAAEAPGALRVRDVLGRSEAELAALEASLDPRELADLQSWFAKPSRVVVEEHLAAETNVTDMDRRYDERQRKIAEAIKAVEPAMIALLERHNHALDRYTRPVIPPPSFLDESIFRIKVRPPAEDDSVGDLREYERDGEIEDALRAAVPQAVLRDLYRAETDFELRFTSPFFEEEQPPEDPWVELRAVVREKRSMPPPIATYAIGAAAKLEFRSHIAGPWAEKLAIVKAIRQAQ